MVNLVGTLVSTAVNAAMVRILVTLSHGLLSADLQLLTQQTLLHLKLEVFPVVTEAYYDERYIIIAVLVSIHQLKCLLNDCL